MKPRSKPMEPWRDDVAFARVKKINRIAGELWKRVCRAIRNHKHESEALRNLTATVQPGLYEHFKSSEEHPMLYASDGAFIEVNAKSSPAVPYMPLYAERAGERVGRVLLDPKDGFWGPINRPKDPEHPWVGQRFRLLRKLTYTQVGILKDNAKQLAHHKTRERILGAISRLLA